jgi:hypothetical protein
MKLEISPAYKRFTDMSVGFNMEYQFEVLETSILLDEKPRLEKFTFIDWEMFGNSQAFLSDYPFRISSSVRRSVMGNNNERHFLTANGGLGYGIESSSNLTLSFMTDFRYDNPLSRSGNNIVSFGPRIFLRYDAEELVINLEGSEKFDFSSFNNSSTYVESSLGYYLREDLGFIIKYLKWEGMGRLEQTEIKLTKSF